MYTMGYPAFMLHVCSYIENSNGLKRDEVSIMGAYELIHL